MNCTSIRFVLLLLAFFPSLHLVSAVDSRIAAQAIASSAGACIVLNGDTGRILFEKNGHEERFPASCTKVATLAYVLSLPNCLIKKKIVVPKEAVQVIGDTEKSKNNFSKYPSYLQEMSGTSARFVSGEKISIEDALYGMMLISGNDAANTLAYHFGAGKIDLFMKNLNQFLVKIGCKKTHFTNPHGLHHPDHASSAYDLGLITFYGMKKLPLFRQIVGSIKYTKAKTNKQGAITWTQSNKLLQKESPLFYEYATGVKTGRHMRAMENIIASGELNGRRIILVFLQCPERLLLFQQAKKMLKLFLDEKKEKKSFITQGSIQLTKEILGHPTPLRLKARESFDLTYFPSEEPEVRTVVHWYPLPLSIKRDDPIGEVQFFVEKRKEKSVILYALEDKKPTFLSLFYFLQARIYMIYESPGLLFSSCIIVGLTFFLLLQRKKKG